MADVNGSAITINDRELNSYIITALRAGPEELNGLEAILGAARAQLRQAQRDVEQAELDARINAVAGGKNAEERKLQQEQAVAGSPAVRQARAAVADYEDDIATNEIEAKLLARKFQGALALAELQAARINLMTTYAKKETVK